MTLESVYTKKMNFFKEKSDQLQKKDLSRKGSIDSRIIELVDFINIQNCFFTTSSCSGRTVILTNSETKKKGCNWIFVSHDIVHPDDLIKALLSHSGSAVLKFEPFVLHIQCLTLEDAQRLHHFGIEAGFKNSGISIGKHGKTIVAIRSTLSLEVPLSLEGNLLVSKEYISFLVDICNEKIMNNWKRTERFYERLQTINNHSKEVSESKKMQRSLTDKSISQDSDVHDSKEKTLPSSKSKKMQRSFTDKSISQNSDVHDSKEKTLPSEEKLPIDTYYEGFHTLLNGTEQ